MIQEIHHTSIRTIMDRLLRDPLLQDLQLEAVIQYTLSFIGIVGLPKFFIDRVSVVDIDHYKGKLPNGVVSINMVKNASNDKCMRRSTDEFYLMPNVNRASDLTYNVQGDIIFVSFEKGSVIVSFKAIPIDEDGLPYVPNNEVFLKALELWITDEVLTKLFRIGKVTQVAMNDLRQQKAWYLGMVQSEFTIPSVSEMESIKNMWCQRIPNTSEFDNGFKNLGDKTYIKQH